MKNTAKLSKCRKYRYALWRTWDEAKPTIMFIGLNPSTADETTDDPTLFDVLISLSLGGMVRFA